MPVRVLLLASIAFISLPLHAADKIIGPVTDNKNQPIEFFTAIELQTTADVEIVKVNAF